MKLPSSVVILAIVASSLVMGQERHPGPLSQVAVSQVQHPGSGIRPQTPMQVDPVVEGIIGEVNLDSLVASVRILSGEDSIQIGNAWVPIQKRGTYAGGNLAADYLVQRLGSYNLEVHDESYSSYGRNVYAVQYGYLYPEKQFILCAHYDAVNLYSADDNASGVAVVLEAARILSHYDFKYTLVYALWDEEEEGANGSRAYASQASSDQRQIQGVLNLDMLGWDSNQDGLADVHAQNTANSGALANLFLIVNALYALPLRPVVYNPGTGQGDQSAFWEHGWGAVLLSEANYGGDLNPYDHAAEDRVSKFNLPYFHNMSKLSIGALSTLIEVSTGPLIASVVPAVGYQTYAADLQIKGVKTHFQENPAGTRA